MSFSLLRTVRFYLRPLRRFYEYARGHTALALTRYRFSRPPFSSAANLDRPLIVSLTSYPPRYPTLLPTLQCLLTQRLRPDRVVLWIAHADMASLPAEVLALTSRGLDIRQTDDLGAYKKLIPALEAFPDAIIVTSDDDTYYPPDWLQRLVAAWDGDSQQIVCHVGHRMRLDAAGAPLPYMQWEWYIKGPARGSDMFPVGVGGVLYPPGCLPVPDVFDHDKFMSLAPGADDLWFYWMGRKRGVVSKQSGYNRSHINWPSSQHVALALDNTGYVDGQGTYDRKIAKMFEAFGLSLVAKLPVYLQTSWLACLPVVA